MKPEGAPATGGGVLGKKLHICKIYGDVPPKWVDFTPKKSVNMGPILTPQITKIKVTKHFVVFSYTVPC